MPDLKGRLALADFDPQDDTRPGAALYAVDREGKLLHQAKVGDGGEFEIPERILKHAHRVYAGPAAEDFDSLDTSRLAVHRPRELAELVARDGVLDVSRRDWIRWLERRVCASGTVRHCRPFPWVIRDLVLAPSPRLQARSERRAESLSASVQAAGPATAQATIDPSVLESLLHRHRCDTICFGQVEVYRRICCCRPWIVWDPRLDDLYRELQEWPRIPIPDDGDPPPFEELHFVRDGAIDERRRHAARDLATLRTLAPEAQVSYIQARPWLRCFGPDCGPAEKVGEGFIQPNGSFNVCWTEPLIFLIHGCHWEYAFVVKQVIDGETVTIYDGLGAGKWFRSRQDVDLVSYHRRAISCNDDGDHEDGTAHALLIRVGNSTDAHHLETPPPTGATSVQAPAGGFDRTQNWGLAVGAPTGHSYNNWGGTLGLYFFFSRSLRNLGIQKYRVRVVRAADDGTPVGTPVALTTPITWRIANFGGTPAVTPFPLGPSGELYTIPYWDQQPWIPGDFHAYLDTTDFANGRHLVILDLFDGAGNLVTPASSGNGFVYKRWLTEATYSNHTRDAMPYLFWWDNRRSTAQITGVSGGANTGNPSCMFIEGGGGTPIRVQHRAYHPEERFQLRHDLYWWRGIGSGSSAWPLDDPATPQDESRLNVGLGGPPASSQPLTIDQLLGGESRCSFGLQLRTHVRTFNGSSILNGLEGSDTGAFALTKV